ncbi:MAG: hypothetical protein QN174_00330 [Armatimonadota bacterium]|nr:hypothetical protein [Armatimonadota bacterium]MDR7422155.1 hypothetical protein [Armatimonadota bacterium]MDR7455430.1 hypothetical protein [Armatimonadota bacterium]MDR7456045.1 hypothetical protein [Armatimonadota bacterium]MDR7495393.1 hypothetical protein [Armatimonadota bacterium]
MSDYVFPRLERVRVTVPEHLRERFRALVEEKGWTVEEGVKILLAYGADRMTVSSMGPDAAHNEWSAARAELAVLRHRAYIADEAIRSLRLNVTGLEASNRQFQRSLADQRARRDRLREELRRLDDGDGGTAQARAGHRDRAAG